MKRFTAPNVGAAEGLAWLRATVLDYVERRQGVTEDRILRHVDRAADVDGAYEGEIPSGRAVDLLFDLVLEGSLFWEEQRRKPDAPLRYYRLRGPIYQGPRPQRVEAA